MSINQSTPTTRPTSGEAESVQPGATVHSPAQPSKAPVSDIAVENQTPLSFKPRSGHKLDIVLTVSIEQPQQALLDYLVQRMKEDINCKIESQPELDFQRGAA